MARPWRARLCRAALNAARQSRALPLLLLATAAVAQQPVSEDAGPMREAARPLRDISRPVGDGSGPVGEAGRSMRSGPVRDGRTRGMLSGPVSSLSRGPMTGAALPREGGSVAESSAGAVKHDIDQPLGARISQPIRELAPLQQQLRQLREQGDAAALEAAAAPVAAPLAE